MRIEELRQYWHRQAVDDWNELCEEGLTFKPIRKPSEWAEEERRIAAGQSPMATFSDISYEHAVMPHCVEPMDSVDLPHVRELVLMWGIRDGKTLGVCMNIMGRTVADKPCNIYDVHPTDDDSARFSESDVEQMITLCLESYFARRKSRESGRTIEFKKFAGGWLRIFSAGSLSKFRGTSVGVLFLHELDALGKESIFKAVNRTQGFAHPIIVKESTPTLAPTQDEKGNVQYRSNIHEAYDQGDKRKWFVPCRECKGMQVIMFGGFRHPEERMDKAAYHCIFCDAAHNENQWRAMQQRGKWFPTAGLSDEQQRQIEKWHTSATPKDPGVRSYWRNGFNSLLPRNETYRTKLHQFVAEEAASHSSREARKTWTNEIAAELWNDDENIQPAPLLQPILDGRELYAHIDSTFIPMRGLIVTCFTDLHGNRLEIEWRAWGRDEESFGLGHFVLDGDTNKPEVWEEWTKHLTRKWKHQSGLELGLSFGLADAGWRPDPLASTLMRMQQQNVPGVSGKIRLSIGVGRAGHAIVGNKWGTIGKRYKGVHIGTWQAKELIYDRLAWHGAKEKPQGGFMHYGTRYSDEFIRQLVIEDPVRKVIQSRDVLTFENPKQLRNEALDLAVGNLAAFRLRLWDFEAVEKEIAALKEKPKEPETVAPAQTFRPMGGFGTGWNV